MAFDVDAVSQALPGRFLLWLEQTDSTMRDAARLADAGCPHGAVVGAEHQTAGQGRHGRSWHSEPGAGLYFSVVLRLGLPNENLPIVTLASGLAVAEALAQFSGLAVDLRWPNDVLVGQKKISGILLQQQQEALICGIGINVNQAGFPPEIRHLATSLLLETGRIFPREPLLAAALQSLDRHLEVLQQQGRTAILRLFARASSYVSGRRVVVEQGDQIVRGVTEGLDEDGFLILRRDDGKRELILAGGLRPDAAE